MSKNSSSKFIRFVSFVAPKLEPYFAKDKDGRDIYVYNAKLIHIIAAYLGVRYEILTPADGEYGLRLPDGNWAGMIGMIQREEADLGMYGLAFTEERFRLMNYSYPYEFSALSFMTDVPEPLSTNLAIFHPFSFALWIALILLTMSMSLVFYFLLGRRQPYQRVLLSTFRSTLENGVDFKTRKFAVKMAVLAWILGMLVVSSGYRAVLLSFLSFPTMTGIRDIPDLSRATADASFKCFAYPDSHIIEDLLNSVDPSWKAIGECLARYKMLGDPIENFLAAPRGKAFFGSRVWSLPFERLYFISEDNFYMKLCGAQFSKSFCCSDDVNRMFHRFTAAGIFDKLRNDEMFFTVLKNPSLAPANTETSRFISLGDLSGAFYILISGCMAGLFTLLIEICVEKLNVHDSL